MSTTEQAGRHDREKFADQHEALGTTMDRRALRTRKALHEALFQLILERDYDGISVSDIADAANVGRSTFYAHFTDKDDLLRSGPGHLRDLLLREHDSAIAGEDRADWRSLGFINFMTAHIKEREQLYRALMRGRAGPIVLDKVRQYICEILRSELSSANASTSKAPASEIAVQFVAGAYMSVLSWWLDRGTKEDPEDINRAFRELALGGLAVVLGP